MKDKKNSKASSTSIAGDYSLWLIENLGTPININFQKAEFLEINISGREWGELFYIVLNCPTSDEYLPKEKLKVWLKRNENKFRKAIPDYPMLGELNDIHSKIIFNQKQVKELYMEVLEVISNVVNNEIALRCLKKLKIACEKALEKDKILYLSG